MANIKRKLFTYKERAFEVRAVPRNDGWEVSVFEDDNRVSVNYTVSHENVADAPIADFPVDLVDNLMELAANDIVNEIVKVPPKKIKT